MFNLFLAFIVATLLANFTEWAVHKHVLHGLGKSKDSFFHYHWRHHHTCRKNDNGDEIYVNWKTNRDVWKEAFSLFVIVVLNTTWLLIWPALFYCLTFWTVVYFFMHSRSHTHVEWGNKWMPWHRDHHMGKNQDLNWCVTFPFADWVLGTRKKYK